jgi:hypothetical protein
MKECESELQKEPKQQKRMYHEMQIYQQLNCPASTAGRKQQVTNQE